MKLFKKYKEIISYLFFGVLTTIVNYCVYALFTFLLTESISDVVLRATVSNIIAWVISVAFAYITNKLWVFNNRSWEFKVVIYECGTFVLARLVSGVIDMFFLPLLISWGLNQEILGITGAWAKLITSVIVIILNYVFSKFIIFRKKKESKEDNSEE